MQRGTLRAMIAVLAAGLLIFVAGFVLVLVRISDDERVTTHALCALRADLNQRVTTSVVFLKSHPHGIPGISRATIETGIVNSKRTINALSGIQCS